MATIRIFCSCHADDAKYWRELRKQLWSLDNDPNVEIWQEDMVDPGRDQASEINSRLSTAEIILLLISPDFMVSQQHYGNEMIHAVERHKRGEARVIPILLRPTNGWEEASFGGRQPIPKNRNFIVPQLNDQKSDEVFSKVAGEIKSVVSEMQKSQLTTTILTASSSSPTVPLQSPTSTQTRPPGGPNNAFSKKPGQRGQGTTLSKLFSALSKKVWHNIRVWHISITSIVGIALIFLLIFNFVVPAGISIALVPGVGKITFGLTDGSYFFSDDAKINEECIYQQNQKIKGAFVTIVAVVTISTTIFDTVNSNASSESGNEDLQGICARQKAYNEQHASSGKKLRVMIANIGTKAKGVLGATVEQVVQDIRQLSPSDSLIGVVGFGFSTSVLLAMPDLEKAGIPVISPSASSNQLSDQSHIWDYFFRVVPDTQVEANYAVQFIANQPKNITSAVVFSDPHDAYSSSLGTDFMTQFNRKSGWHATPQTYTVDDNQSIDTAIMNIKAHPPQMIFCACYANDFDYFLSEMSNEGLDTVFKMGGEALYELGGYTKSDHYSNIYYMAFAFPDTTDILCNPQSNSQLKGTCSSDTYCGYSKCAAQSAQSSEPTNFNDFYCKIFNSNYTEQIPCTNGGGYGQSRPGQHTLLAFDATSALLSAYDQVSQSGQQEVSRQEVRDKLANLQTFQGLSGQITFKSTSRSDPANNKAVLVLYVDNSGQTHLAAIYGQFLENGSSSPQ